MCGIAGVADFARPSSAHEPTVRRMLRALRHRGPDGEGLFASEHVVLGHTQLTIRPSSGQPASSPDARFTLAYTGEIYDDGAWRARLGDRWRFATHGDTEAVLAALAIEGPRAIEALDGMFALALWDRDSQSLLLARDPLGVKPLFYARAGTALAFASEPRALLEALPRRALDVAAFVEHWALPCLGGVDRGLFEGVVPLAPGTTLRFDREGARVERYFRFAPAREERFDEEAFAAELADALQANMRSTCRPAGAHAPFGVLSSGGLDSTIVAAFAREAHPRLPAITLRYESQGSFPPGASFLTSEDDTPYAALAAQELGLHASFADVARESLPRRIERAARIDGCFPAFEQQISQMALFDRAAELGLRIALVGDAADELFSGYHFLLEPAVSSTREGLFLRFGSERRLSLLRPELVRALDPLGTLARRFDALASDAGASWSSPAEGLRATTALIVERWLPRLLWNGDVCSMDRSIEARVPFARRALVELAQRAPPSASLAKRLLRMSCPASVPAGIRRRAKSALPKDPLAAPAYLEAARGSWSRAPSEARALFDPAAVEACLAAPASDELGRSIHFALACLAPFLDAHG
ncbi:MAG: asparagine synthase (glutamine-hydrolyzing) [Sandaracinaceae bacterium]|nr:asparagine synthase (glutamine-hydrolyzing) [Sandaracinaceae bacterium]